MKISNPKAATDKAQRLRREAKISRARAARVDRILAQFLMSDPASLKAQQEDMAEFRPDRRTVERVRKDLRWFHLAEVVAGQAAEGEAQRAAHRIVDKVDRVNWQGLSEHLAKWRSIKRREELRNADKRPLAAEETLEAQNGWLAERITTQRALRNCGRQLQLCVGGSDELARGYARALKSGASQFWLLRDPQREPVGLVDVDTSERTFVHAKGRENKVLPLQARPALRKLATENGLGAGDSYDLAELGLAGPFLEGAGKILGKGKLDEGSWAVRLRSGWLRFETSGSEGAEFSYLYTGATIRFRYGGLGESKAMQLLAALCLSPDTDEQTRDALREVLL